MYPSNPSSVRAASESSFMEGGVPPANGLVICDPAPLYAEAIEAVVRRHTAWQVECATTDPELAACTAAGRGARAIVFDSRLGTPRAVAEEVGRLRAHYPDGPLMLLTAHEGPAFIQSAVDSGVAVCVHKRDDLAEFRVALKALNQELPYCSRIVRDILAQYRSVGSHRDDRTGTRRLRPAERRADRSLPVQAV